MPHSTQTFRLFVSSTFSDLKEERNALQEQVFPKLRKLCEEHGCRFQAIDLRWGVSEEAGLDNKTMQICFEEIDRCKRTTPKPNFLVLLGNRYGWRPLPEVIPADEFEEIEQRITDAGDKSLLHRWYKRDDNNVPPVYILQPREGEYREYSIWVNQVETPLHSLLERITSEMDLSDEQRIKYTRSATEQEIVQGALSVPDADEHVFCYFRDISDLEKNSISATPSETSQSQLFIDLQENHRINESSRERIHRLKDQLTSTLPENIRNYSADWKGNENIPITLDHIPQLCADVETDLTRIIKEQIDTSQTLSPLYQEILAHEKFAEERAKFFIGREDILNTIREYTAGSPSSPLVIYGASGSGKSALMAKAWEEANQEHPETVIISRFIGATPSSTDIRSLLKSLCTQIRDVYSDTKTPVPSEYNELVKAFPEWLKKASAHRPLLLFFDALDQLSPQNDAHRLYWLPKQLPPHVSLIVSVMDWDGSQGECFKAVQEYLPHDTLKQLTPLTAEEGAVILDSWLTAAYRTLQSDQRDDILRKFEKNGLPLYLKLAFEEAKRWRSYDSLPCGADTIPGLAEDIPGIIRDLFARLEHPANHGLTLVSNALGYLIASKNGLTEDEMLDVLSLNKEVMNKRSAFWPYADRLPVILWSRLYFDLEPYVAERSADNTSLISFYHRQLREVSEERYLSGDKKQNAHSDLASYFGSKKNWQKTVPLHFVEDFSKRIPMYRKVSELPYQEANAGKGDMLYNTLTDFDFIDAKNSGYGPYELIKDYSIQSNIPLLADQPIFTVLNSLKEALQLSSHILREHQNQLASQLYCRLMDMTSNELVFFVNDMLRIRDRPWFKSIVPSFTAPSGLLINIMTGHTDAVTAIAITPDGKRAVSGSGDMTIRMWDLNTGEQRELLTGHTDAVTAIAITPDGKRAISASLDKTVRVWDLETGKEHATLTGHGGWVYTVTITPDGKRAVSGSEDSTLRVWDLETREERAILIGHTHYVYTVAITPDGKRAVSGSEDRTLRVWDLETGEQREILTSHIGGVYAVAITPDGKRAVSGSEDSTLRVWDLETGEERATLTGHRGWVYAVSITPDGKRAVSGSDDRTLRVWDLETGKEWAVLTGHTSLVKAVAITPEGKLAVSGSGDRTLRVWDLEIGKERGCLNRHIDEVITIAIYPKGKKLVDRSWDCTLRAWVERRASREMLLNHTGWVKAIAITPDGKRVVSASDDKTIRVWDLETGKEHAILTGHTDWVTAIAITPDGKSVISSRDKNLWVWDLDTGMERETLMGHTSYIQAVAITPDGKRVISSWDNKLWVWDLDSEEVLAVLMGHTSHIYAIAVTPDGKHAVSGSWDKTLKIWDLESGRELNTLTGHADLVTAIALTPDGKRAVSGSQDRTLRVWDLDTGEQLEVLKGHTSGINAVAVTHDGKRAVSGSNDKTLRVWDLESGKLISEFSGEGVITSAVFSQILNTIVVGDVSGRMHFLRLENIKFDLPIYTARHFVADDSYVIDCAYCQHRSNILKSNLETEITCPQCNKKVKLNPFAFDDPPRTILWKEPKMLTNWIYESTSETDVIHPISCTFSYAGSWNVSWSGGLFTLWNDEERKIFARVEGHKKSINSCVFSPDGTQMLSASDDCTLKLWEIISGKILFKFSGHEGPVICCSFSPDGTRIVSGSSDSTLRIWDAQLGKEICRIQHPDPVTTCTFSHDGTQIASGSANRLYLWEGKNGNLLRTFIGHSDRILCSAYSFDESRIITGSEDRTIKVWDVSTGCTILTIAGLDAAITACAFSPHGNRILSGLDDFSLKIWDAKTGKRIQTFKGHTASIMGCVLYPNGKSIYFVVKDNMIRIWDIETGRIKRILTGPKF